MAPLVFIRHGSLNSTDKVHNTGSEIDLRTRLGDNQACEYFVGLATTAFLANVPRLLSLGFMVDWKAMGLE